MNSPRTAPTTIQARPRAPSSGRSHRASQPRSRASASRNDTVTNSPKVTSAQEPTDIGDHDLKFGPASPGVVFHSMCQKRSGWVRSSVSRMGQGRTARKAA